MSQIFDEKGNVIPVTLIEAGPCYVLQIKTEDKDKYADIVTEMWFNLKNVLDEIDIPNDPQLMRELAGRQYSYDNKNRYKIESKLEYKKRYGKSPDKADALILTFYQGGSIMTGEARNAMASRRRR